MKDLNPLTRHAKDPYDLDSWSGFRFRRVGSGECTRFEEVHIEVSDDRGLAFVVRNPHHSHPPVIFMDSESLDARALALGEAMVALCISLGDSPDTIEPFAASWEERDNKERAREMYFLARGDSPAVPHEVAKKFANWANQERLSETIHNWDSYPIGAFPSAWSTFCEAEGLSFD